MSNLNLPGIKKFEWSDNARKRPAMYTGDLFLFGIQQIILYLLEDDLEPELSDAVIIEAINYPDNRMSIRFSGIDVNGYASRLNLLYDDGAMRSNFGTCVLISLSSVEITINQYPEVSMLIGKKGEFTIVASTATQMEKSITIDFTADPEIFKNLVIEYDRLNIFWRQLAYLNPGWKIISVDKTTEELQRNVYHYPEGVLKQLDNQLPTKFSGNYTCPKLQITATTGAFSYHIGISAGVEPYIRTFAGNQETPLGGSLESGIIKGFMKALKKMAEEEGRKVSTSKKLIKKQCMIIGAVRGDHRQFVFHGCTKSKLFVPEIKESACRLVFEETLAYLNHHPTLKDSILHILTKPSETD